MARGISMQESNTTGAAGGWSVSPVGWGWRWSAYWGPASDAGRAPDKTAAEMAARQALRMMQFREERGAL
jgi:hypothetical protein